jgi:hypothetical protein
MEHITEAFQYENVSYQNSKDQQETNYFSWWKYQ